MPAPPDESRPAGDSARFLAELRASRAYLTGSVSPRRWLDFGHFHWSDVSPGRAARAAVGVITPLALGMATGHLEYGSFAALGALPAGFVAFRGITRTRVLAVVVTAAGMAASTFVGAATAAGSPWLLVPVVVIWAYLVGLIAALGPTALVVALQWPVALLIASALPLSPGQAAVRACLVLAGGLWQGALVVSAWALSRGTAERAALAGSYRALSRYAAQLAGGSQGPPPPAVLPGTEAIRDPNPLIRTEARLHLVDLVQESGRIRSALAALGGTRSEDTREFLARAAVMLAAIADAIASRPAERERLLDQARQEISATPRPADASRWEWAGAALLGQLRSTCRILGRLNDAEHGGLRHRQAGTAEARRPAADAGPGRGPAGSRAVMIPRAPAWQAMLLTLRATVGSSSEAGRHALRLAAVAGVAELIAVVSGLPHGYWAVLTVFIVLRPDYSSTLYRGLQRAAGTVLGAGLGVATVLLSDAGSPALLAGIAISLAVAYATFTVSYLLYAVFLTDFVVVLLALLGLPPEQTAVARLIGTCVGTALALLAYLLWPSWEGSSANEKFARLFEAQGRYASALLRSYSRPGAADMAGLRSLKLAARRARSDAMASADRLADEPSRPPMTAELAQGLTSAGHRLAQAALTLDAAVQLQHRTALAGQEPPSGPGPQIPSPGHGDRTGAAPRQRQLDLLADGLTAAASEISRSLRALQPPGPMPALRPLFAAITVPGGQQPDDPAGSADQPAGPADGLAEAADGLVDAADTAADILRRHLQPRAGGTSP